MAPVAAGDPILKVAVLAVGGQGGGVLSGWIAALAEANGFHAQATSVPGVAQRTGATIYYVEMKRADPVRPDRRPVFALMPAQGDVDVVVASELVEVGRAMLREFVTPDRTVLIGSAHRDLTVTEKQEPGDGRKNPAPVLAAGLALSARFICFDMREAARAHGAHISAALFGALSGSGALPFEAEDYRAVIRASGKGVERSLAAFDAALAQVDAPERVEPSRADPAPDASMTGPATLLRGYASLSKRVDAMPVPVRDMARRGLAKVVDFQDLAYGKEYLDRLDRCLDGDRAPWAFGVAAAKHVANAMAYDDIVRVADLKTRASRDRRLRAEIGRGDGDVVAVTEFFHPRSEEVIGLMPARLGAWFDARPDATRRLDRLVNRGLRLRTDRAATFALLWSVAGLRAWRRSLFRHRMEVAHLERWLALALETRGRDHDLGVEVLECRRLVKGYSDTHARGLSKFDRVLSGLTLVEGRRDAADWIRRLRAAALRDEAGTALDGALRTIREM